MAGRQQREAPRPGLDATVVTAFQERLLDWYSANRRDLPWRHTRDPYAVLVSETMLQQTQVSRVVPKYQAWLQALPRLEELAAAPLDVVLRLWQGLGYNTRARRLRDCATAAVETTGFGGAALPRTLPGLLRLPGLGPYTARAILVFAHNEDVAAVDTNVRRVLTQELGLSPDLGAAGLQAAAEAVLPRGRSRDWHNALMDYGAMVLTARAGGSRASRRQDQFVGSRRWQRSRLLQAVLERGPQTIGDLAVILDLSPAEIAELVALLERDGLLVCGPRGVRVA
jgi:A/G-specific adenine glycosylase